MCLALYKNNSFNNKTKMGNKNSTIIKIGNNTLSKNGKNEFMWTVDVEDKNNSQSRHLIENIVDVKESNGFASIPSYAYNIVGYNKKTDTFEEFQLFNKDKVFNSDNPTNLKWAPPIGNEYDFVSIKNPSRILKVLDFNFKRYEIKSSSQHNGFSRIVFKFEYSDDREWI
jgi:hypothetical protein